MGRTNDDHETVESFSSKGQKITVREGNGYMYNIQLDAKVEHSPEDVYDILTGTFTQN